MKYETNSLYSWSRIKNGPLRHPVGGHRDRMLDGQPNREHRRLRSQYQRDHTVTVAPHPASKLYLTLIAAIQSGDALMAKRLTISLVRIAK